MALFSANVLHKRTIIVDVRVVEVIIIMSTQSWQYQGIMNNVGDHLYNVSMKYFPFH